MFSPHPTSLRSSSLPKLYALSLKNKITRNKKFHKATEVKTKIKEVKEE